MSKAVFSSRADEAELAFADALTKKQYGISFGQFCGTILLDAIASSGTLPTVAQNINPKVKKAFTYLREFPASYKNSNIGKMSDTEISELIAERYA